MLLIGADEKEDSILGSILLPSFHISMLSVDDHISRKYAFKVKRERGASRPLQWALISCVMMIAERSNSF